MTSPHVRVVDADQPRSVERGLVQVAVGVLIRDDHAFLMTTRPPGKAYAGYWEFPGGKLEAGETVAEALRRELQEEIGITITDCQPWQTEVIDYPHALVQLTFAKSPIGRGSSKCAKPRALRGSNCLWWWRLCCQARCRCCSGSRKSASLWVPPTRRDQQGLTHPAPTAGACFRNPHRLAAFDRASGVLRWPRHPGQYCGNVRHKKVGRRWPFRTG